MRYVAKKAGQKFEQAFGANPKSTTRGNEGDITIDKMPSPNKPSKNSVGEYVDYEEVE